jgi:hypothetical protein
LFHSAIKARHPCRLFYFPQLGIRLVLVPVLS